MEKRVVLIVALFVCGVQCSLNKLWSNRKLTVGEDKSIRVHSNSAACSPGWTAHADHCYKAHKVKVTWHQARRACAGEAAMLARATSPALNQFLFNLSASPIWLNAQDAQSEGEWTWSDTDTPMSWATWQSGEPNNVRGREHCLMLYGRRWLDAPCGGRAGYVCVRPRPHAVSPDSLVAGGVSVAKLNTTTGFVATIQYYDSGAGEWFHFCGGTLVSRNQVLTLAWCAGRWLARDLRVGLGWPDLDSFGQSGTQTFNVLRVEHHPKLDVKSWWDNPSSEDDYLLLILNDIAIIYLEQDILPTATVYPMRMMKTTGRQTGQCRVLGYGASYPGQPRSGPGVLKEAVIAPAPRAVCEAEFKAMYSAQFRMTKRRVCTVTTNQTTHPGAACTGDHGAPIICDGRLWGMVQYLGACQWDTPQVSVKVPSYRDWVRRRVHRPSCAATREGCCDTCDGRAVRDTCAVGGCPATQFGCCPGTATPAPGPGLQGCPQFSCVHATFGCCPCSGDRAAKGENFQGCPYRRDTAPPAAPAAPAAPAIPVER